jgi:hypothetical protein
MLQPDCVMDGSARTGGAYTICGAYAVDRNHRATTSFGRDDLGCHLERTGRHRAERRLGINALRIRSRSLKLRDASMAQAKGNSSEGLAIKISENVGKRTGNYRASQPISGLLTAGQFSQEESKPERD